MTLTPWSQSGIEIAVKLLHSPIPRTFSDSSSIDDCSLFMRQTMKVVECIINVWGCAETLPRLFSSSAVEDRCLTKNPYKRIMDCSPCENSLDIFLLMFQNNFVCGRRYVIIIILAHLLTKLLQFSCDVVLLTVYRARAEKI